MEIADADVPLFQQAEESRQRPSVIILEPAALDERSQRRRKRALVVGSPFDDQAQPLVGIDHADDRCEGTFAPRRGKSCVEGQGLIARGVFVRKPGAPGLDRCIRVSAAPEAELDVLAEVLPAVLEAARS